MQYQVAAASKDGKNVDSHFGQAKIWQIAEVDEEKGQWKLIKTLQIEIDPGEKKSQKTGCFGQDNSAIEYVADRLKDCQYILVQKIGPKPQKILQRHGLTCLETEESIDNAIEKLMQFHKRFARGQEKM